MKNTHHKIYQYQHHWYLVPIAREAKFIEQMEVITTEQVRMHKYLGQRMRVEADEQEQIVNQCIADFQETWRGHELEGNGSLSVEVLG